MAVGLPLIVNVVEPAAAASVAVDNTNAVQTVTPMRTHTFKTSAKMEMLRPGEVRPQGWLRDWCVKSVDGESLELVPYGCTKLRISMFPDDAGKTEK